MDLDTAINRMTILHRRGSLVPFIGAGMSVPSCTLWDDFIQNLERKARIKSQTSINKIRRAEIAVSKLLSGGADDFYNACRTALRSADPSETPLQTKALGRIEWPLVITTNYDDWYPKLAKVKPEILGRSDKDCRQILSTLNLPSTPLLWCIQGYLGRIAEPKKSFLPNSERESSLFQQVVVGHDQYQEVISQSPLFRRAFAEVYRSRSFLFMGTGLEEDYLVNLFSEILNNYRTSKFPHFALLKKGEQESGRSRFLTEKLNIHVVEYDNHSDLPGILNEIAERLDPHPLWFSPGATLVFRHRIALKKEHFFELRYGSLYQSNSAHRKIGYSFNCIKDKTSNLIKPGSHGEGLLADLGYDAKKIKFEPIDPKGIIWKAEGVKETIFGIIARNSTGSRDLRAIRLAVRILFNEMDKYSVDEIRCGLIGQPIKDAHWDSTFSLVQLIQGYKDFVKERRDEGNTPDLLVCSGDFRLFSNILAGKINVDEILACHDIRFWTLVHPALGREREVILLENEDSKIGDVMEVLGLDKEDADFWLVETLPKPNINVTIKSAKTYLNTSLSAFGVLPGSRLIFTHRTIVNKLTSDPSVAPLG